jgi:hypothetical protein
MTVDDVRLSEALARAAEPAGDPPLSGAAVRRHARRRAQRIATGTLAALVLFAGLAALPFLGSGGTTPGSVSGTTAGAGYVSWPARGDLAGQAAYETAAVRAWDSSRAAEVRAPHTEVRVLYAAGTDAGPVVVVTGVDREGERRVAMLWGAPFQRRFGGRLQLAADRAGPDPSRTRALTFWPHTRSGNGPGPVVVVAEPSVTTLAWAPYGTGDRHPMTGSGGAAWTATGGASEVEVAGWAGGETRFATRPVLGESVTYLPATGRLCGTVRCGGPAPVTLAPAVTWSPDRAWFRPVDEAGWDDVTEVVLARVEGRVESQTAVWTGRLPDDADVYATVVRTAGESRFFVVSRFGGYVDVLLDRPAPAPADANAFAVVVPRVSGSWVLFATGPGVTSVEYSLEGGPYRPVDLHGGAASMVFQRDAVPDPFRWRVRYVADGVAREHEGPLDSSGPL